jgi:hypothetical protein
MQTTCARYTPPPLPSTHAARRIKQNKTRTAAWMLHVACDALEEVRGRRRFRWRPPPPLACQSVIAKISHHNPCGQLQRGDVLERAHHGSHTRHTTSQRTVSCTPKKRTKLLDRHGSSRPARVATTSFAECCNFSGFQHVNQPYCSIAKGKSDDNVGVCQCF